ncbi:MAG: N-formylglutamate amidohydrolase [Bacteroidia bacterium]|nr:N-formylglutamate amidohydrolase [Bacteroidia bacterium]
MVFEIVHPKGEKVPLVVSIPHCGVLFPDEIRNHFVPEQITEPDDTDWYLQQLYDFVPEMGITLIFARYSRWVIDLNRDPESKPLYNDGRVITGLTPDKTFFGENIYRESSPDAEEIQRRLSLYYRPYHTQIRELLTDLQQTFSHVLLYDAHSIRRRVPSIYPKPFPDLILGDNEETSAHPALIRTAWETLVSGPYQPMHNTLFKGGYITRHFGQPQQGVHALQLERSKDLYMDDTETRYAPDRAAIMQKHLRQLFTHLLHTLQKLNDESL